MVVACLLLVAGKGKKNKEPEPPPAPAPVEAPAPAAEPEPPPPPPEPVKPKNASLTVTFTFFDGTTKSGKVTGIERAVDFNGDEGWSPDKLQMYMEIGTTEKAITWTDIKGITVTPGKMPDDVDCTYSSDFTPWMYECTLRTTAAAVLKDGSKGNINTRNRWRFYFEDGSEYEFQVFKYTVREQDTKVPEYGDEQAENTGLYTKLQDQIRTDLKGKMIKSISVQ